MIKVSTTAVWSPKRGNTAAEYEDAYWLPQPGVAEAKTLRFAVADGASEGMLSRAWADILVRRYCQTAAPPSSISELLSQARRDWQRWLKHYWQHREHQNKPVQWFEEPGLEKGAFSTLLGLTFKQRSAHHSGLWLADAIGDSCLLQVRADHPLTGFPIRRAADFDSRPYLLASNPAYNQELSGKGSTRRGEYKVGDCFLLMTDALAQWCWREIEAGGRPWQALEQIARAHPHRLDSWLDSLRAEKQIRNDDVTLVWIEVLGS